MFFRLEYVAQRTLLHLTSSEFPIRFNETAPIKVALLAPEGDPSPQLNRPDAICRVELEKEPDSGVRSMFEGLTRGQLPDDYERTWLRPIGLPNEESQSTKLSAQVVFMPQPFRDFLDQVLPPMSDMAARVMDLLRWRFDRHAAIFHESADGFKFSFDHKAWHNMPSRVDPFNARALDSIRGREFGEEEAAALSKELLSGSAEPLAHALWREAWDLRLRSPRSSLLVGFTAAETGLKRHIVRMLPVTKNLVMAMPSPPIKNLIDYIDVLHNTASPAGKAGSIPRRSEAR